jgi:hypothetical protein
MEIALFPNKQKKQEIPSGHLAQTVLHLIIQKSRMKSISPLVGVVTWAGAIFIWIGPALAGHQLEAGISLFHFDYVEDCPPPLKSTEKDWLLGSYGTYAYRGADNPFHGRLHFEYASGSTAYDGTDQQGVPLQGKTVNSFLKNEIDLGLRLTDADRSFHLTPYGGAGYKRRERDLGVYSEEYSWKFLTLGMLAEKNFGGSWSAGVDGSVRFMYDSRIKIRLS